MGRRLWAPVWGGARPLSGVLGTTRETFLTLENWGLSKDKIACPHSRQLYQHVNLNNGTHGVLYRFLLQLLFLNRYYSRWIDREAGDAGLGLALARTRTRFFRMMLGFSSYLWISRFSAFLLHPLPQAVTIPCCKFMLLTNTLAYLVGESCWPAA